MQHPDWNHYRQTFPDRYWKEGLFDQLIEQFVQAKAPARCLDIGGGAGTRALSSAPQVHLLDPFVDVLAPWMTGRAHWETPHADFDLVVARGSINYLTPEQLAIVPQFVVSGGHLLANTFLDQPSSQWRARPVTNGKGEVGEEMMRCIDGVVEHQLHFPSQSITHHFFYHTRAQWEAFFPGVRFVQYASNSYAMLWGR